MADGSTYALQTYQAVGNREDLMDIITDISPEETPMFSSLKQYKANATYMEWLTDSLNSAKANAQIEGADFSFSRPGTRTRVGNYTQIFTNTFAVAGSQESSDAAGVTDEKAYQADKALKEHKRDIEYAIMNGTGTAGTSGVARELKGIPAWITTNSTCGNSSALTETMYNDLLDDIWNAGGNPDTTYVNGYQKRKITGFTTPNQRTADAKDKRLVNSVAVYESDYGVQTIVLDRYVAAGDVLALQKDLWGIGVFRPSKTIDVAKVGDSDRGAIVGEFTVVSRNQAGSGKLHNLYSV